MTEASTTPTDAQREAAFLEGLVELSRRTGVFVVGCGCCGSPSLDARRPDPEFLAAMNSYDGELVGGPQDLEASAPWEGKQLDRHEWCRARDAARAAR